ncbi:MAG: GNAT family N-acetyltransferase [Isosphaeraceae bacterium]
MTILDRGWVRAEAGVSDPTYQVQVVDNESRWQGLEPEWDSLFEQSPDASPFLRFGWLRHWWKVYGPSYGAPGRGLRICLVRRGDRLVGVIPLYEGAPRGPALGVRRIRFLSTGEDRHEETCPDYLGVLCLPGEEEPCLDALRSLLRRGGWDHLELVNISEHSPLVRPGAVTAKLGVSRIVEQGVCPIADLDGGFEAYLRRLSGHTRQWARRLLRETERFGAVFALAEEGTVAGFFDDLVRLHQERWVAQGEPGCFASHRFVEFHRALAREWVPAGHAVLARLQYQGEPVAVIYGFRSGSKFHFYQSGVRRDSSIPLSSPGNLANLLLMRRLAECGITQYDFLRGSSLYKDRLSTVKTRLFNLHVWRPTIRTGVYWTGRLARNVGRRMMTGRSRTADAQTGESDS